MQQKVSAWVEEVSIPTYEVGVPELTPVFLEKRVYQGSSGAVYPLPVIEKIYDHKIEKKYKACFLENEYLKIMILPELGGRVQMANDKIKKRHFVYYNQVIKPALVGLTGPWISGGIEFNWPQHHRPSTFDSTEFQISENTDGSCTVWINEIERMTRTKALVGFSLYPEKAYLELQVKLYNPSPLKQSFLWWANPAVKVNDDYQSIFPPDVNAVFDHGKRDVSAFPIAKGTYYKVDYSKGVDISRYKNIPVPTSFMAAASDYNFMGCYENDTQAGMLHVANHHLVPGKKQWTWGYGDFGKTWDQNLTDEDGPYIELMCGAFTDNQPDFTWIMPNEEKTFSQYFLPFHSIGYVKNACKDAALNFEIEQNAWWLKIYVSSVLSQLRIVVFNQQQICHEHTTDARPEQSIELTGTHAAESSHNYQIQLWHQGRILLEWKTQTSDAFPMPKPAEAAPKPKEIATIEELFLTAMHLEQYRHATFSDVDYYEEALRRSPHDARCNNAMGLFHYKNADFVKAVPFYRKAIETYTFRNPNPIDGEPFYNLAWCLKRLGHQTEAYKYFYKSVWSAAWQDTGFLAIAQIETEQQQWTEALLSIEKSLLRNWHSNKARHLKTALYRKLGQKEQAIQWANESIRIDRFNLGCVFELVMMQQKTKQQLFDLIGNNTHTFIEYSLDYAESGLYTEAIQLLGIYEEKVAIHYPMVHYFLAFFYHQNQQQEQAAQYFQSAAVLPSDYCFPNRIEEIQALELALQYFPHDYMALYYIGNFKYAKKCYEQALASWTKANSIHDGFAILNRNLALAFFNHFGMPAQAMIHMRKAFALSPTPRLMMELDQLSKKMQVPIVERLERLEQHMELCMQRDDLVLERATLHNQLGNYSKALSLLCTHQFHPWEGGEGKVAAQYTRAKIELAKQAMQDQNFKQALHLLKDAIEYPPQLGEGKLPGMIDNELEYWLAFCYEQLHDSVSAVNHYQRACSGDIQPSSVLYYNDQQAYKIFYQGLSYLKLQQPQLAILKFELMIQYAQAHANKVVEIDYFAVSLPDLQIWNQDLSELNTTNCLFIHALGNWGLGKNQEAILQLEQAFNRDKNNQHIQSHLNFIHSALNPIPNI
jgi:tetratricopeptide (TPR) repeat protein